MNQKNLLRKAMSMESNYVAKNKFSIKEKHQVWRSCVISWYTFVNQYQKLLQLACSCNEVFSSLCRLFLLFNWMMNFSMQWKVNFFEGSGKQTNKLRVQLTIPLKNETLSLSFSQQKVVLKTKNPPQPTADDKKRAKMAQSFYSKTVNSPFLHLIDILST